MNKAVAGGGTLTVESLKTEVQPDDIPDWLGKRPPVEGDWTQTFDDEFNGAAVDPTKWNLKGPNWYDKISHFTPEEDIVANGMLRIQYEKKTGFQNDDPKKRKTDYAVGYLDSGGKWTQRYGYFECRLKPPTAPGLWPAFWMMPDRGPGVSEEERSTTKDGGMEFDIYEFLSGWGPYRYNIAVHWDGYEKDHKSTGSASNYARPDKDGFLTVGLLWTPGAAHFYCNGREVLDYNSPRVSSVQSFFIFTMPSGGWDNIPLEDAKLPDALVVDYVRAWQRKDLASPGDGMKNPPAPPSEGP